MKWLEIIELRSINSDKSFIERQLRGLIEELNKDAGRKIIEIYNRIAVESDFSIHLPHHSKEADVNGSPLGLRLVAALKEFGLINHSVWIERFN